jgi:hypothetical protein
MSRITRSLGQVKLVQVQPCGLIIETPSGHFYDVSRRVDVEQLLITPSGIEATTPDGEHVLDIHHMDHPDKAYDNNDLISIGFTSHYEAMRSRYGDHMIDGTAGENIIIAYESEVWTEDLGEGVLIENADSGRRTFLRLVSFAPPCEEFSHFVARSQQKRLPAKELKDTLKYLNNGRRGFLLVMDGGQENAIVKPGDKVYVVERDNYPHDSL